MKTDNEAMLMPEPRDAKQTILHPRNVTKPEATSSMGFSITTGYIAPWASQMALVIKNSPANAEDKRHADFIHGSGRSPGE